MKSNNCFFDRFNLDTIPRGSFSLRWIFVILFLTIADLPFLGAQVPTVITRDGTVGNPDLSVQPVAVDGVFEVKEEHGNRPGGGVNLFHSFSKFDVGTGDTALFTATQETANVISRVTGGDASLIHGNISSNIDNANLYLLNPAGIFFGPNARLDVQGSFYASTADYLRLLENDPTGMLTFTNESRLATANPIAFGFLDQPIEISVDRSVLEVPEGETLSFIGGDITIKGESRGGNNDTSELDCGTSCLKAPGGRIQFATGSPDSEIPIDISQLVRENLKSNGKVEIGNNVRIDVSGDRSGIVIVRSADLLAGSAEITADMDGDNEGNLVALDVKIGGNARFSGTKVRSRTTGIGNSGSLNIDAEIVLLETGTSLSTETGIPAGGGGAGGGGGGGSGGGSGNDGSGNGSGGGNGGGADGGNGNDGSENGSGGGSGVSGSGGGSGGGNGGGQNVLMGKGGDINIKADQQIEIVQDSNILATSNSNGDAGQVNLTAPIISVRRGSRIGSIAENSGDGGNIFINAAERFELTETNGDPQPNRNRGPRVTASTRPFATGKAGSIFVTSPTVILDDGARISSSTSGGNDGGSILINANESVTVSGKRLDGSGSSIRGSTDCEDAECADIDLPRMGNAGRILIQTPSLTLNEGTEIITNTNLPGKGGTIELDIEELTMTSAVIQSTSTGKSSGDAGNIFIGAQSNGDSIQNPTKNISLFDSEIETIAEDAGGGDIAIKGKGSLRLQNGSAIDASDTGGDGGNVKIRMTRDVIVVDTSKILARAEIAGGDGGFIEITTEAFIQSPDSEVDAENEVVINAPVTNILAGLTPLSIDFLHAPELLQPICAARVDGSHTGSFVIAGKGTLQPSPEEILTGFEASSPIQKIDEEYHQDRDKEVAKFNQSLEILENARLSGDALFLAQALSYTARKAFESNELKKTSNLIQETVNSVFSLPDSDEKLNLLIHLAKTIESLAKSSSTYRKRNLLNAYQALSQAQVLAEDLGDSVAKFYILGNLGSLYQIENRFPEALHLTRLALLAAEEADVSEVVYRLHWQEGQLQWALGRTQEAINAYRRAVNILTDIRSEVQEKYDAFDIGFRQTVAPIYLDLVDALLQTSERVSNPEDIRELLLEARSTVEQLKSAELRDYFGDECITELESKEVDLEYVSKQSAIIYPIQLSNRLELLVSLPSGMKRFSVEVEASEFTREIRKFRQGLEIRGLHTYLTHAQKLYDWLIRPLESELAASSIETLVFVPDGPLLTVPLAALHDGEQFLIGKYALAMTPGLNLTDPQPLKRENLSVLAVGLSESVQGFPPLPHVSSEIDSIQDLYGGELLIDEEFTDSKLAEIVKENSFDIVHIASHGQFKSESGDTFILMFDDKLYVDRLNQLVGQFKYRDEPLELLMLSACETAAGDDRAALGLAGIAIRAGARSALGTIWLVNDKASSVLVSEFYQQLQGHSVSRAIALQKAQLKFIDDKRYNHPYYWSPFLLINNWL